MASIVRAKLELKIKNKKIEVIISYFRGNLPFNQKYKGKVEFSKINWDDKKLKKYNGFEVLFNFETNEIENIEIQGQELKVVEKKDIKVIEDKPKKEKSNINYNQVSNIEESREVKAPYNFIPLNEKVVKSDVEPELLGFDKYQTGKHTGYIDINIEAKTDIHIRDCSNEDGTQSSDFFSPANKPRIPGSSFRGMLRNMVEICSFGKFGFFDDKLLYYRALADKCKKLRTSYQSKMSSFDRNSQRTNYKMSAGLLYKSGLDYFIIPSTFSPIKKNPTISRQCFKKENNNYKVYSGLMHNKKHDWEISGIKNKEKSFLVPKEDVYEYVNDKKRSESAINVIAETKNNELVPCFYVRWKDADEKERISFGHTPYFRLAYEKYISEHISLKDDKKNDIDTALFGNNENFASRIFVEDFYFKRGDIENKERMPHILSSPNPTSFQLYLEQENKDVENLKSYNDKINIRGNKLYWHKSGNDWEQNDLNEISDHETQYVNREIKPIGAGATFTGRIRFENLSDVELGAIIFALKLKDNLCHKIGMGKPLGLGSIKITPTLHLSNREERYKDLFAEWSDSLTPESEAKVTEVIKKFENYVLQQLDESKNSLWELDRMKELEAMLNWDKKPSDEKTKYMELNEFRNRNVLPKPTEV